MFVSTSCRLERAMVLGRVHIKLRGKVVGVMVSPDTRRRLLEEKGLVEVVVHYTNVKSTLVRSVKLETVNV